MNIASDKRVLITGATRGTGFVIAQKLAANGNELIINYAHNSEDARNALRLLRELGADADIYRADVSDEEELECMFQNLQECYGAVDILIHCAGLEAEKRRAAECGEPYPGTADTLCIREFIKYYDSTEQGTVIRLLRNADEMENFSCQDKNIRFFNIRTADELETLHTA